MQEEKLHQGGPQINGVFEYAHHKQSFDKELCHKQLCAKKYNACSKQTKFKIESFWAWKQLSLLMCLVLVTRFRLVAGRRRPLICDRSDKVHSPRHGRGPSPQARGVRARSLALQSSDHLTQSKSITCTHKIVQARNNNNNNSWKKNDYLHN